jgi:hypothetical protein
MRLRIVAPALLAAALAAPVQAEEPPLKVWVNPGFYSHHFSRDKDLRDRNFGFGLEVETSPRFSYNAGSYANSVGARSHYAGVVWRPLEWRSDSGLRVAGGVAMAAVDGYPNYHDSGWFVALLPVLSIEGEHLGVSFALIPTFRDRVDGALGVQLKLKVW